MSGAQRVPARNNTIRMTATTSKLGLSEKLFEQASLANVKSSIPRTYFPANERDVQGLMHNPKKYKVGIVGATGAVGVEIYKCLHARGFPIEDLQLFTSAKSAGTKVETPFGSNTTKEFSVEAAR